MKIIKLEPSQRVKDRWLIWLDDGSLLRATESEVAAFALYAGKELTGGEIDHLTEAADRSRVRGKALDLLSVKPLSRKELLLKLTARPFHKGKDSREKPPIATPEQAEAAANWLEDLGYLNDREYAKEVVRHYSAKGYGERRVKDELFRRGVPREYWDEALLEAGSAEDGVEAFLRSRFKGTVPDARDRKRASDALARRGYRWDEIREGLRRYGAELEDE